MIEPISYFVKEEVEKDGRRSRRDLGLVIDRSGELPRPGCTYIHEENSNIYTVLDRVHVGIPIGSDIGNSSDTRGIPRIIVKLNHPNVEQPGDK